MATRQTGSRGRLSVAALCLLAVLVTSCGGSDYTYVASTSTHTFLKVPHDWKVFKKDEVLAKESRYLVYDKSDRFLVAFDGNPTPSLSHSFVTGNYPFGQVRVRELGMEEHDQYSFASLRNEVIPLDDLLQSNQAAVELLSPARLLTKDGLRGTKLEYSVRAKEGTFRMSQIGFVDTATHTVWFLAVGCSAACYERNKGAIHRVVDSWTVEGK